MRLGGLKPYLDILRLVWPLALGMVNNAILQFVDRAYLSHHSILSLEAVLPSSVLAWIFLGFFQSVVAYSGVFVAQCHGAGDAIGARRSYRAGFLIALVSGIAVLAFVPLGHWIFSLTASSPELAAGERAYFDIVTCGGICVFGQMAAISYFTGIGRTRIVFWTNLFGNLLNIALDPILIFGVSTPAFITHDSSFMIRPMGVAGAAWATVISLAVQWLLLAAVLRRVQTTEAEKPSIGEGMMALVWRILRFGIPSGGYAVLNMLSFTIFVFVTGREDAVAFAASNACFTVNYLLYAPMEGFALGAQTLVGQARGRGDDREANRAVRRTLLLAIGCAALATGAVLAFSDPILAFFAPSDVADPSRFAAMGRPLLWVMGAWLLFDSTDVVLSGALKGAGDTRFVFWWMLATAFGIWMPLVFWASAKSAGMVRLWGTIVVYVIVITVGSYVRWRNGRWRRHALLWSETKGEVQ